MAETKGKRPSYPERVPDNVLRPDRVERAAGCPLYGATKACPACGGDEFADQLDDQEDTPAINGGWSKRVDRERLDPQEHTIVRTCRRCGWTTRERPLYLATPEEKKTMQGGGRGVWFGTGSAWAFSSREFVPFRERKSPKPCATGRNRHN